MANRQEFKKNEEYIIYILSKQILSNYFCTLIPIVKIGILLQIFICNKKR